LIFQSQKLRCGVRRLNRYANHRDEKRQQRDAPGIWRCWQRRREFISDNERLQIELRCISVVLPI